MSGEHDLDADVDSAFAGNHLLKDLDSYLDDINSRLTISRMVGDSVTRGMINAMSEESAEVISSKDAEINELNRRLQLFEVISTMQLREQDDGLMSSLSTASEKHIQIIKREIEWMRCIHVDQGRSLESLTKMNKDIDALREIISTVFRTYGQTNYFTKEFLEDQPWQWEIEREVYAFVMQETVRQLREECERKLCEQKSLFDAQYDHWLKKVGEISGLHQELESVSKSMLVVELDLHHLLSQSSRESYEEVNNIKNKDYFPGKEYGESANRFKSDKVFEKTVPDDVNLSPLSHMSNKELTSYYKAEISEIKRQLESSLHEKTEELFRVKRQFLKERAILLTTREKELEALKKGLPDICLRLDEILLEAKQISSFRCNHEKMVSLEKRIEGLLSENKTLHDLLVVERKMANQLASEISEAAKEAENSSLMEKILVKEKSNLQCEIEEARMEAFIKSQIDKCIFSELIHDAVSQREDASMEIETMGKIYSTLLGGLVVDAQSLVNPIMVCVDENKFLREVISQKDKTLKLEYEKAEQLRQEVASLSTLACKKDEALLLSVRNSEKLSHELEMVEKIKKEFASLPTSLGDKESALSLEVKRSKELSEEVESLRSFIGEKDKFILDVESKLRQQKSDLDRHSEECNKLKVQLQEQERSLRGYKSESELLKSKLDETMKVMIQHGAEIFDLTRKLKNVCKNMEEAEEEKTNLYAIIKEKEKKLSTNSEQMASMAIFVQEMSRSVEEFERIILRNLEKRSSRLLGLSCECDKLSNWGNLFKRRALQHNQEFEIRSRDLRKEIEIIRCNHERAENEVDRLGDEVDDLVDVLEKVYIALDHYSPVLKHYVGVMEILEMIKRKLKEVNRQDP